MTNLCRAHVYVWIHAERSALHTATGLEQAWRNSWRRVGVV
jgi:hypothetical protein